MNSKSLMVVTFWLGVATNVCARDLYVNNRDGDDARDGSSPSVEGARGGPCRSITRALQLAANGDRLVIANTGQPYRESLTLQAERHSGTPSRPFTIVGNGAVLDGSQSVPPDAWEHYAGDVYRFRPARMSFQILYLSEKPARRRPVLAEIDASQFKPLEWCLYNRHIYFRVEPGKSPRQYPLSYTGLPVGVTLYEVRHVVLSDFVVQGYQLDGINAHDGVVDATFTGMKCRGNGRSGISVGGASRVNIKACLIGDNGVAQVRTEGFSRTQIINCDLLDNTAPAIVREGGLVTTLAGGQPHE